MMPSLPQHRSTEICPLTASKLKDFDMTKTLLAAAIALTLAGVTTAQAHRTSPLPVPAAKADFAKDLFKKLDESRR